MYKTFQLKIKNTNPKYFEQLFREGKYFYNTVLATEDIFSFDTKSKSVFKAPETVYDLQVLSSQMKQELKDLVIQNIKGLSVKKKNGYKVGKLKFKKFINAIPLKNQTFNFIGNKVRFQGNNKHKFKVSGLNQIPENSTIKSGALTRNPLGIYLHVTVEVSDAKPRTNQTENPAIGIDLGIKDSISFSDGTKLNTNFSEAEFLIRNNHKNLSRKKKGSKNREKAKLALAKSYQKLNNQKKDAANKILNKLKTFKVCFQDEMILNWQKGLFGKKVHKGILGRIKDGLRSNPENLMIPRTAPTTKLCSECGVLNKINLNQRTYSCDCGYQCDRDTHSARNMILIGTGRAYVEKETSVFEMLSQIECKYLSVKQEANAL